ncbi:hypothetical protein Tco_0790690 [Tanacetum coccineum]
MGVTLSGSQGLSSPQANGYVILSSCYGIHCCCWSAQVQVIAAVFVAVSILKAFKTADLSRKLEVNYVKFQFRGGLLGIYLYLLVPTGRYVVPTGRVIATDSVIVATSGYVVPAAYDISPGRVK